MTTAAMGEFGMRAATAAAAASTVAE